MRTPQYSRGSVRRPSGRMTVLSEPRSIGGRLPVGERRQPRIDVRDRGRKHHRRGADRRPGRVRGSPGDTADAWARQVPARRPRAPRGRFHDGRRCAPPRRPRQRPAGPPRPGINARQELIAQHDVDRLVELVEAPDARSAGHGPRTTGGDDAAIRSLQAHGAEDASWSSPPAVTSSEPSSIVREVPAGSRRRPATFRRVTPIRGFRPGDRPRAGWGWPRLLPAHGAGRASRYRA